MDECGGALIGIALVLVAVFVPTAFMGGIAGAFYKQFALTIASATVISLLVSLTLSPALAAVILTPHDATPSRTAHRRAAARARRKAPTAGSSVFRGGYASFTGAALRHARDARGPVRGSGRAHGLARDRHAAGLRAGAGPERRRGLAHDAAGHQPRAHGCGRAADHSDRSRHARRVVRVRVRRHGRHRVHERHERRPDLGHLRPFRGTHSEGPVARVHLRRTAQAARRHHGGGDPRREPGVRARHGQRGRLPDDGRGPRRARVPRARGSGTAAHGGGAQGSGHLAVVQQLQYAQPDARCRRRSRQSRDARRACPQRIRDAADVLGRHVRQQHQYARSHISGNCAGRCELSPGRRVGRAAEDALGFRRDGAAQRDREARAGDRAVPRAALQPVSGRGHPGRHRARPLLGRGDGSDGAHRARDAALRHDVRMDGARVPAAVCPATPERSRSRSASCSCSSSWRRSTRASRCRWP